MKIKDIPITIGYFLIIGIFIIYIFIFMSMGANFITCEERCHDEFHTNDDWDMKTYGECSKNCSSEAKSGEEIK